jgi:putative NADPH-quinone reductase
VITQTTIWKAASDDDAGLKAAMKVLIDEHALRYAGIRRVAHVYFHAVKGADDANRRACMDRARQSGRGF